MVKHKLVNITLCVLSVYMSSCYLFDQKHLKPTARVFMHRVIGHMGEDGSFPYNPKGQEYCLYDMWTRSDPNWPDLEVEDNPTKAWKLPCDFDYTNKRVTNSVIKYINRPNLYFESDPENAIVILEIVDKRGNAVYVYTSDFKIFEIKNIIRSRKETWPSFLGIKIADVQNRYPVTLISDYIARLQPFMPNEEIEGIFKLKPGTLSLRAGSDNGEIHDR